MPRGGLVVGVDGEVAGVAKAERAEVVEAHDVVGVAVGVEDGVDVADAFAEGLRVEVGAGVDEDDVAVVRETDGGAGAAVTRVRRRCRPRSRSRGWAPPWRCRCPER